MFFGAGISINAYLDILHIIIDVGFTLGIDPFIFSYIFFIFLFSTNNLTH